MTIDKQSILLVYYDLFSRGEMLKAQKFINDCVSLPIIDDPDIKSIRKECNDRIDEIKRWSKEGRPYPGTHAIVNDPVSVFPKFKKALEIIEDVKPKTILDVGCYAGDFIKLLPDDKYECWGIDIHKELMRRLDSDNPRFIYSSADNMSDVLNYSYFDVVILFDVLEHCFFPEAVIAEVDNVAVPGAKIMINLPQTYMSYEDDAYEHLSMFSIDMIHDMFRSRDNYAVEELEDEHGDPTFFITYNR